jgi:transglutaminase-like putative cysteine protease
MRFGNRMYYTEAKADKDGKVPVRIIYRVKRQEVRGGRKGDEQPELFLKPDAKVPIDGKPLTLLKGKELPADQMRVARLLYDIVHGHMRYSKEGTGWGQGDAVWACDSRYGNCSDFHSLFISLARSQGLPARFEIGYPLPEKRGQGEIAGYHCWAWFKPGRSEWIPVDISEASKDPALKNYYFGNLTENRVAFTVGRDLVLAPPQAGPPLNFFIYPYAEVDGKPYPAEKVKVTVSYQDVE